MAPPSAKKRSPGVMRRDSAIVMADVVTKWFAENGDQATSMQLEVHRRELERTFDLFNINQDKIEESTSDSDLEEVLCVRRTFMEKYLETKAKILTALDERTPKAEKESIPSTATQIPLDIFNKQIQSSVKFNGDRTQWHLFRQKFESLYGKTRPYTDAERLMLLQDACTEDAYAKIWRLEPRDENYLKAIDTLAREYEDVQLTCTEHIAAIFNLLAVPKDDVVALRKFVDELDMRLTALQTFDRPVDQWCDVIVYLMKTKLDRQLVTDWSKETQDEIFPCHQKFVKFLQRRCQTLERTRRDCQLSSSAKPINDIRRKTEQLKVGSKPKPTTLVTSLAQPLNQRTCPFCNSNRHGIMGCGKFSELTVDERKAEIVRRKLCENCLRGNHETSSCRSTFKCRICRKPHHILLHTDAHTASAIEREEPVSKRAVLITNSAADTSENDSTLTTLLPTVLVYVRGHNSTLVTARCLIDTGSQKHLITEEFAQYLRLTRTRATHKLAGLAGAPVMSKSLLRLVIQSRHNDCWTELEAYVVPSITDLQPGRTIDPCALKLPNTIQLADPTFFKPAKIDILLGIEVFNEILSRTNIKHPYLLDTKFGQVVIGCAVPKQTNESVHVMNACLDAQNENGTGQLNKQLERFWEIEEGDTENKAFSSDEHAAIIHFADTHTRSSDGRFQVRLPFKTNPDVLGDSRRLAEHWFHRLENTFKRDAELQREYSAFMQEFIDLGHMQLASEHQLQAPNYYLPHHHVTRPDSTTTKIRVVFNGSAKTSSGKSLNDTLLVGPVIQSELFPIIIRARLSPHIVSADIIKMFRQIMVHPDDQRFQLVLWRNDKKEPIRVYAINRIVYGLTSSPYLATACIKQLAEENMIQYPIAANALINDCYVDNILSGCESGKDVKSLVNQLQELLKLGQFELHKWCSSEDSVLADLPPQMLERKNVIDDKVSTVKTLGLRWDGLDNFRYSVDPSKGNEPTKRKVLREIAKIFDPLGLVNPAIVPAKHLMQCLCKENIVWDENLNEELRSLWLKYRKQLVFLEELCIPRPVRVAGTNVHIHCFCDASSKAYGSAVYIVANLDQQPISAKLLCARSRIAPLKTKTIARLELCAALMGAELVNRLMKQIQIKVTEVSFWTDSEIVLHWIAKPACHWEVFVSHRVQKIQNIISFDQWYFVPTELNPADLVSRGSSPESLLKNKLWFNGPEFLLDEKINWPKQPSFLDREVPEKKKIKQQMALVVTSDRDIITSTRIYTSFSRLQRCFAWIARWRENTRTSTPVKVHGPITVQELEIAQRYLLRFIQRKYFAAEINALSEKQPLPSKSKLRNLNPKVDEFGILRVGGRLDCAESGCDNNMPVILPQNHPLTTAIVRMWHLKLLHAGPKLLLGHIRNYYWPIRGLQFTRMVIANCTVCFRARPLFFQQQMGQLPACRVRRCDFPFENVGVDYAGPFDLSHGRGRAVTKLYVCVFICMATRAIHIETVLDLSTEGFLSVLRRFISRRGLCRQLHSDNMKAFISAKTEIKKLYEALEKASPDIQRHIAPIEWKFIPPRGPHHGGIWEAAVKSFKYHLKRCLPATTLKLDEWNTLLAQIEAVLNSRPIASLGHTIDDIGALTPGHFIIGAPLVALPESAQVGKPIDNLARWRRVQAARDSFWRRWSLEYVQHLQYLSKWHTSNLAVNTGTVVLIKDEQAPPQQWRLGIITKLHPGKDGLVRVVTLRSAGKEIIRDIRKIAPLPIEKED